MKTPLNIPLVPIVDCGEILVPIPDDIRHEHRYFAQGWDIDPVMRFRSGIVEPLRAANRTFRDHGVEIIIWNAHRSLAGQRLMREAFFKEIHERWKGEGRGGFSEEDVWKEVDKYAAPAVINTLAPSPHMTGGAIDSGLVDLASGAIVEMETGFDELSPLSAVAAFDDPKTDTEKRWKSNRRLWTDVMSKHGFSVNPSEWWHMEMGTRFDARVRGYSPARYGVIDAD